MPAITERGVAQFSKASLILACQSGNTQNKEEAQKKSNKTKELGPQKS